MASDGARRHQCAREVRRRVGSNAHEGSRWCAGTGSAAAKAGTGSGAAASSSRAQSGRTRDRALARARRRRNRGPRARHRARGRPHGREDHLMGGRLTVRILGLGLAALALAGCDRRGGDPYARKVSESIPRIEKATGLTFKTPPKWELKTRDEVRDFLLKKFDEETPAEQLKGEESAYK